MKQYKMIRFISTVFILMITTSIMAFNSFSQKIENTFLNISVENGKVTDYFKEIEKQTDFTFLYSNDVKLIDKKISIKNPRISLSDALTILSKRAQINYLISETTISVKVNKGKLKTASAIGIKQNAQTTISGTVSDADGIPLPGANVIIKDTSSGVSTNFDGEFSLDANPENIIVISYAGYVTQEILVGNQKNINITLIVDINSLEEVVVVAYGTSKKKDLTSAITSLKGKEIIEDKPFTNVESALKGKVSGIQVIQNSGSPGETPRIRIRGTTSLLASVNPLYVIDGLQTADTEGLNPNDVESVSVLKDAAATAIYGTGGANGVIIITTKRGKNGKAKFNYSSYIGQENINNTLDVLNSEQYLGYVNEARVNVGEAPVVDPNNLAFNTDWQKELYQSAVLQNHQLSFSKGTDKGNYYLSAGFQEQEGTVRTSAFERYSLRLNWDQQLLKRFKVGSSVSLLRNKFNVVNVNERVNQGGVILSGLQTPPILPVRNSDGTFPDNPFQGGLDNPIALIEGESREFNTNKILGNIYGEYDFGFGLTYKSSLSVDYKLSEFDRFTDPFSTSNGRALNGRVETSTFLDTSYQWENILKYNFEIFEDLKLEALLGTGRIERRIKNTEAVGLDFPNGAIQTIRAANNIERIDQEVLENANNYYFYRLNFNYLEKYFLSGTARRDGSSRFGANKRFSILPSVSASWIITEENFMKNIDWLNQFKVRYSYGVTGNDGIGNFLFQPLLSPDGRAVLNGNEVVAGVAVDQLGNEDLRWETTAQHNLGFDVGFLNNRVTLTTDIYRKKTTDLLVEFPLPVSTGFNIATQNIGAVNNEGIELAIDAKIIDSNDFKWSLNANYTKNKNEVVDLGGQIISEGNVNDQGTITRTEAGQPVGNFYGFVANGVDPETGNIIFEDLDGNNIINDNDRTVLGNPLPDFTWGITSQFNYKGFGLIAFFQGVEGNEIYNASRFELENQSSFNNQLATVLNRWTPTNRNTNIPRAAFGDPNGNGRASSRWVEDGSYIKLREVTLSYTLPKEWVNKFKISNLKLYIQGRNLYTWTDYSGYDPEVNRDDNNVLSTGIDYGTYPQVRTYVAGLNLTF